MKNPVILQSFEWYLPDDGSFYQKLAAEAKTLKEEGYTAVWLPPVCKATGPNDVGYGIYDLFDLGEFEQKGGRRTKYGTKEELLACISALHDAGLLVYADVVMNHKAGADEAECCQAVPVNPDQRLEEIGPMREIEAWTRFDFPGRAGKYSDFTWNWTHFTGVDYDQRSGESGIFRIIGENKGFAQAVSREKGNFDYLMFADIDHAHPDVREHLIDWALWFIEETGVDGFRLDAVKHMDAQFVQYFTDRIAEEMKKRGRDFYLFGENWVRDTDKNEKLLDRTEGSLDLFDVGLHFSFFDAANAGEHYDLRTLFDSSLTKERPMQTVTFVDNHDTQPGQALTSWVKAEFKAQAYAGILLRKDGYPCVFAADRMGAKGPEPQASCQETLLKLLKLRRALAYGDQSDHFENEHAIAWVRHGLEGEDRHKLVVILSNGPSEPLHISLGEDQAG